MESENLILEVIKRYLKNDEDYTRYYETNKINAEFMNQMKIDNTRNTAIILSELSTVNSLGSPKIN
jgi:hypothetical protein